MSEEPYPFESNNLGMSAELIEKIREGKATCTRCGKRLEPNHWLSWEACINDFVPEHYENIFCSDRCREKWHKMSLKQKCEQLRKRIKGFLKVPVYTDCVTISDSYIEPEKGGE